MVWHPKILNCEQFRPFWVSWKHGKFGLGQGSIKEHDVILEVQDPDFVPVYRLVVTFTSEQKGEWIFNEMC